MGNPEALHRCHHPASMSTTGAPALMAAEHLWETPKRCASVVTPRPWAPPEPLR